VSVFFTGGLGPPGRAGRAPVVETRESRRAAVAKSDAELVADLHRASDDALDLLLRRYARLVHRVAANILRDPTEAEDITQEVFFEISRKAHLYDPERGTVKVWLLQYAYHRTLRRKADLQRRAAYRGEPIELLEVRPDRARPSNWSASRSSRSATSPNGSACPSDAPATTTIAGWRACACGRIASAVPRLRSGQASVGEADRERRSIPHEAVKLMAREAERLGRALPTEPVGVERRRNLVV
jgi:RNA polymerase sigma factor (sigma-70 family)